MTTRYLLSGPIPILRAPAAHSGAMPDGFGWHRAQMCLLAVSEPYWPAKRMSGWGRTAGPTKKSLALRKYSERSDLFRNGENGSRPFHVGQSHHVIHTDTSVILFYTSMLVDASIASTSTWSASIFPKHLSTSGTRLKTAGRCRTKNTP